MTKVPELFGSLVFDESTMRELLPKETYKALQAAIAQSKPLTPDVASIVAAAMKSWALEKGATHFTHWFQPMTGITAEKHDSFISPTGDGRVIMEFSGKELIKGEPDASSFPSGGLRATFEARGYTAWDPSSFAFIKDNTLCIPTAFCSYSGEALDKKTPLLRSMEAVSKQAVRVLHLLGKKGVENVKSTVGAEQEYFLIDKEVYLKRKDLIYTGRTLFGAEPPKGQQLEDHYFGAIKPRVAAFMQELDEELWKLGVPSKTRHNEVAPAQHEMAPVFNTTNVATDQNQLAMELMKKIAARHGMVCLLHEKPFAGVNGSGKHNNWSLSTDAGENLLEPGSTPYENAQFLLFLAAVIKAVDDHQDLLRVSVASAGNDHRLGANEAPPAIVSMFLGDELTNILEAIEQGSGYNSTARSDIAIGADVLPTFPKDNTDRNRTSPFAFTGNKFEFRMLGSSFSVADSNTVLNTIVAEALSLFAADLEKASDINAAIADIVARTMKEHKRIIFNGNNYAAEWVVEAEKRGLLNLRSTPEALKHFATEANAKLFEKHGVLSRTELHSRQEIFFENYAKIIAIEASCLVSITRKRLLPAVLEYSKELAATALAKKQLSQAIDTVVEEKQVTKLSALATKLDEKLSQLIAAIADSEKITDGAELADFSHDKVFAGMEALRAVIDEVELIVAKKYWPVPTYGDLLFSVQ
ncbi:MAG: glutamine synthetase III [Christensenellaceae bacterium]|jgi:glutamine synthetase|nr:glutamine synthetase III [Christensenellaceae bacterium]